MTPIFWAYYFPPKYLFILFFHAFFRSLLSITSSPYHHTYFCVPPLTLDTLPSPCTSPLFPLIATNNPSTQFHIRLTIPY
ncbi:hypothetical protein F5Y17DRAFT_442211 [Xylariaceae sp. FL0594]|nr:hypothetical protein F5Y17DRAFT_442211 [Xylariaceae sp. FL0594]